MTRVFATSSSLFNLGGVIPLGHDGDIALIGGECKKIYLFQHDWSIDRELSFSKLKYKKKFLQGEKVKVPESYYHIVMRPEILDQERRETYLRTINDVIEEKSLEENRRVKSSQLKLSDTVYAQYCKSSIKEIHSVPISTESVELSLFSNGDHFKKDIHLRVDQYGPLIEIDIRNNPLRSRGNIFNKIETGHILNDIKLKMRTSYEIIHADGYIKGDYNAFSQFEQKTYYEKVCWTTRTCKKFAFIKRCKNHHHCRNEARSTFVLKEMISSQSLKMNFAFDQDINPALEDKFYKELYGNFLRTNFISKVLDESKRLVQYEPSALLRRSEVKSTISARILKEITDDVFISLQARDYDQVLSDDLSEFIKSSKFKCLVKRNLKWIPRKLNCL